MVAQTPQVIDSAVNGFGLGRDHRSHNPGSVTLGGASRSWSEPPDRLVTPRKHPRSWLKGPQLEFDFLTFEEAERFLDAADPEWRPMFTLALRTGLRIGELRALRWDDVDLVAGRLVVRRCDWRGHLGTPKSGRNRELPLSGDALAA